MRINLIPEPLRPTRPSPLPYMPVAGLSAICLVWLVTQFANSGSARTQAARYRQELRTVVKQFTSSNKVIDRLEQAEKERSHLKLKAAAITVLTHTGLPPSGLMYSLARLTPADLRLTDFSLDEQKRTAILMGYGSEEKADIEVASLLRALNGDKALLRLFHGARLNFCNSTKVGNQHVKKFSISLLFRDPKFPRRKTEDGATSTSRSSQRGAKNRR